MIVRIDRVATRGGDGGETGLGDGTRVGKDHARIEAMGAVDEANAALGRLRTALVGADGDELTRRAQNDLFDLGAGLCRPGAHPRLAPDAVAALERFIEAGNLRLEPLRSFVLPGGSAAAAEAHLARTVVRRAERRVVALGPGSGVDAEACRYLNRLSDALFVLGRLLNDDGRADIAWVPAAAPAR